MSIPSIFAGTVEAGVPNGVLTVILPDGPLEISSEHANFMAILTASDEGDAEEVRELYESGLPRIKNGCNSQSLEEASGGRATYRDGYVYLDGAKLTDHPEITKRIQGLSELGLGFDSLLRFLERVEKNPSYQSRQELFDFLENKGLPITEDGYFLAYKAVRVDFKDKFSGTLDNSVGNTVRLPRGKVDDNRSHHCSAGLHCGALDYVSWYGGGNDRIIVVKVDPADVVSVPTDCQCMKLRTCAYEVVQEFERGLLDPVYDARANGLLPERENRPESSYSFCGWDDDHDDYEDDYYDPEDVEVY